MNTLVRRNPGSKAQKDRSVPETTAPTDAIVRIVRIVRTTKCGTDLHVLQGDALSCAPERIFGRECVGVVDKVGTAVTTFHPGDHVIVSRISTCGKCAYCRGGMYSHCVDVDRILGDSIGDARAEYVRTPFADANLHHLPTGSDEEALVICEATTRPQASNTPTYKPVSRFEQTMTETRPKA